MSNYGLIRLKNSARTNQIDCVINYFFQLYLMLYVYVQRFDVTRPVQIFFETNVVFSSIIQSSKKIFRHQHGDLNLDEIKKRIAQFACKSRDKSNEPN